MNRVTLGAGVMLALGLLTWLLSRPTAPFIPIHPLSPAFVAATQRPLTSAITPIKIPQRVSRDTATELLSDWWAGFSAAEAARYSVELIHKDSGQEKYQVYYLGRRVEQLIIRRDLSDTKQIIPIEKYKALDEHDDMSEHDVEKNIRAQDAKITGVVSEGKVWSLGPNLTLYPAYKFSVTIAGALTAQEWIVHAKSGEVTSINTFSRD